MAAPSTATPGVRRDTGLGDASRSAKDDSGVKRSVRRCLPGLVRLVPIRSDEVGGAFGDHDGGRVGMAADEASASLGKQRLAAVPVATWGR
jgi:hypothetical protein